MNGAAQQSTLMRILMRTLSRQTRYAPSALTSCVLR